MSYIATHAGEPAAPGLFEQFFAQLLRDCYRQNERHADPLRFGPTAGGQALRLRRAAVRLLSRRGFSRPSFSPDEAARWLAWMVENRAALERTYARLADAYSRETFLRLLRLRALGPAHVSVLGDPEAYWARYDALDEFVVNRATARTFWDWNLNRYRIPAEGGVVTAELHPLNVLSTFVLEQYRYRHTEPALRAGPGQTIIDAGGCWGDTALYFADLVGSRGCVYTLEFVHGNLDLLRRNLAANPELAQRVRVVEHALGAASGETLAYHPDGPGTSLSRSGDEAASEEVTTVTIDELAVQEGIARVDFIKMDIEGAELDALRGAERTLRRDRPTLGIALYHKPEDLFEIPDFLDSLQAGYTFYLDHFTAHAEETVLFAHAPGRGERPSPERDSGPTG